MPRGAAIAARIAAAGMPLALAASLVSCTVPGVGDEVPGPTPAAASTPSGIPQPPTPSVDVPVTSSAVPAATPPVPPTRLVIDAIRVDMPVEPVGVDRDAQMELPDDPAVAGWYRFGPDATSEAGNIVLAAHVDAWDHPIGPLARLRDASPGDLVTLTDARGTERVYVVDSVGHQEKRSLAVDELFRRDGEARLVVITCGGPIDPATGLYRDNVVVIARPT